MSEVEVRMALVGPTGKSLKFLNNKNNLADMYLQKRLHCFQREKFYNIQQIDHEKIDAMVFMKHIKKLDAETPQAKKLLDRSNLSLTPDPAEEGRSAAKIKAQQKRKVRLAQTAPASMHHNHNTGKEPSKAEIRNAFKSGPSLSTDRSQAVTSSLDTDRKKSVYLQISGTGREKKGPLLSDDDSDEDEKRRKDLPTPSPRTMLNVMIGLNAFSHVPPPRGVTITPEVTKDKRVSLVVPSQRRVSRARKSQDFRRASRRDSLVSNLSAISSTYDSTENIAEKFLQQWRARVASRRQSIYDKLAIESKNKEIANHRESLALSSVPEFSSAIPSPLRRKSKWSMTHRQSVMPAQLPVISQNDDQERRELFQAWVKERKDDVIPTERPDSEYLSPQQKTAERRKSFAAWLKKRDLNKCHFYDEEDDDMSDYISPYEIDDGPQDIGDMMKTILDIKKRFKDPVDFRLKKFYKELDKIKERDEEARRPLSEKEQKRKWKITMKGIDAALADSSDEDDNYYNTV